MNSAASPRLASRESLLRQPISGSAKPLGGLLLIAGVFAAGLWVRWPAAREEAAAPLPPLRLNLNHATAVELQLLPTIGPELAQRMVRFRERNGNFQQWEDVGRVSGIGPATLEAVRPWASIDQPAVETMAENRSTTGRASFGD